jgi:hypothetical protein
MAEKPSPSSSDEPADDRDLNVRRVQDFVAKSLRHALKGYLGKPDLEAMKHGLTRTLNNIAESMGLGPEGEPLPPPVILPEMSDEEMVRAVEDTLLYQPPPEQVIVEQDPSDPTRVILHANVRLPYSASFLIVPLKVK